MKLIQYMLPHGRTKTVETKRPPEIEGMAAAVVEHGWRFECEILRTGEVSITCCDPEEGIDLVIEVVPNGPEVPGATDRVVREAYECMELSDA